MSPKPRPSLSGGGATGSATHFKALVLVAILAVCGYTAFVHLGQRVPDSRVGVQYSAHPVPARTLHAIRKACPASSLTGGKRRYLVTGAAGFIGFHAAGKLAERGDVVVGVDNFNEYYPVSIKRARADALADHQQVTVIDADINDMETILELFRACAFTHVLHLAAQAGVRYAARNPFAYVSSNVAGSVAILEAIKAQKPMPVLVYASSSSVYGLSKRFPFTEDDRADIPASLYAATKRGQELITHSYYNIYGVSATGLRFFTVYGPWGRPDMSVLSFAHNVMDGKPIRVFQGPNQTELARDFTYVDDIVAGILGSLDTAPPSGKATATYRLFNLGNTRVVTVSEMVQTLEQALNKKAVINYVPLGATGDVLRTNANITAASVAFGYAPKTDIKQGLANFAKWYFEYYGADGSLRPADERKYVPD